MGDYKLSASLQGHEDDVRGVVFPHPNFVVSASRDATVRLWKLLPQTPPTYDDTIVSHGTAFVNSLAFVPPSSEFPEGLIVSGGQDTIIDVRQPAKAGADNADALLLGHGHNVCALDVSEDGKKIVSGSWDNDARIWQVGKWEESTVLRGHGAAVWAVLAYDKETIITGCADQAIRVFHTSGKLIRRLKVGDVVRALCRLPPKHPSGAHFASSGNDAVIRLWTLEGREVAQLHGHESFVYSLAALPDGNIVSSSEDRTARIWSNQQCIQTITHPAISVWCVAVCPDNGDIVTGASDRIVRVFSKVKERQAEESAIEEFNESVRASAIPQQTMPNINKDALPGPDFLTSKSGTKEGQVQMIKELNGDVCAYTWSTAARQWVNVGTVVEGAGSDGKKISHEGKDYDFVFDVDIEEGKPPLKLPFNVSQNPYEVARKFCADNKLPVTYLDQVTNFIVTNTQGTTIGQSQNQGGADPWGTEHRYRPGDDTPAQPAPRPKLLPQKEYLDISTANHKAMFKKLQEFNQSLIEDGSKDVSLNPHDIEVLDSIVTKLEKGKSSSIDSDSISLVLKIATAWPADKVLPGLDVLRLITASSGTCVEQISPPLPHILADAKLFEPSTPPNNTMMAIRAFVNLFKTKSGRDLANAEFETIHKLCKPYTTSTNRNTIVALTTLYINFAVLLSAPETANADRALTLLDDLSDILKSARDSEAMYRAVVAAGTLFALGKDFCEAGRDVFGYEAALKKAEETVREPRIRNVVAEIRDMLG
ncbi:phospholipase A-2-activating protein [Mytilinidion resinicola]|uniref:Phospholipase A-2-activating protein n=1 Tax=Mytilinidion resinicola TaxID=574789 RepID=A0A6A6YEW8_9PEZI|nr:phospholipase A-2-activating protein [Mytilinidion resinicola]KAF2807280.1 phospholipase A-2-activating protein [Mytilinidion resinicola]